MTPAVVESLGWLGFSIACLLLAAAIGAVIVCDVLDERHRRRTGHVPSCTAPRGWRCTCPPS